MAHPQAGRARSPSCHAACVRRRHPPRASAVGWHGVHDCGRGAAVVPRRPPQATHGSPPRPSGRVQRLLQAGAIPSKAELTRTYLGVRNQLMVDMRGSQYICFVNGQLIAAVTDNALTGGQVGVWVDDNSTVGLFNDFTVYPAA
jgi:hypothetical protein